jgi:hypothetical protein
MYASITGLSINEIRAMQEWKKTGITLLINAGQEEYKISGSHPYYPD